MPTPKGQALERRLRQELERAGYAFEITRWPRRMAYRDMDGRLLPNLPADPYHMERLMARGFMPDLPRRRPEVTSREPNAEREGSGRRNRRGVADELSE